MSENAKDAMDNLLREGTAKYLDALYALHRFRREVTDVAIAVLKAELPALKSATGFDPDNEPYLDYVDRNCKPDIEAFDGNWAWITANVWFPKPWNSTVHLGLRFDRSNGDSSTAYVTFMSLTSGPRAVFDKLNSANRRSGGGEDRAHYYEDAQSRECGFRWKLENPLAMKEEFQRMMDYVIKVWTVPR